MQYTSAQAAKLLRRLGEEHQLLLNDEMNTCVFLAATGEDVDSLRPGYDYTATQQELAALEAKIRKVRHAINVFNSTTTIDGMTIDIRAAFMRTPSIAEGLGGDNAAISLFPGYLYMC